MSGGPGDGLTESLSFDLSESVLGALVALSVTNLRILPKSQAVIWKTWLHQTHALALSPSRTLSPSYHFHIQNNSFWVSVEAQGCRWRSEPIVLFTFSWSVWSCFPSLCETTCSLLAFCHPLRFPRHIRWDTNCSFLLQRMTFKQLLQA